MRRKRRQAVAFRIGDGARFQALLKRLVRSHGTGEKAARATGISQPTFSRTLRKREGETVSLMVMDRIEEGLARIDPRLRDVLAGSVMSTAGMRLYRRVYMPWCEERTSRFLNRRGTLWVHRHDDSGRDTLRKATRKDARRARRSRLEATWSRMKQDPETRAICNGYERKLMETGASPQRRRVALVRIVEPLAEWADSGYIEREWADLSAEEKKQYLRWAFQQELLLLRRPHDQDRVNEVAQSLGIGSRPWSSYHR